MDNSTEIIINCSLQDLWEFFTTKENWQEWWGGNLQNVDPGWQTGAKLLWENGNTSTISNLVPEKEIQIGSAWLERTFRFSAVDNKKTRVEAGFSPRGGASFSDGGAAHKKEMASTLNKLKLRLESMVGANEYVENLVIPSVSPTVPSSPKPEEVSSPLAIAEEQAPLTTPESKTAADLSAFTPGMGKTLVEPLTLTTRPDKKETLVQESSRSFEEQTRYWGEKINLIQTVATRKTNLSIFIGIPAAILLVALLSFGVSGLLSHLDPGLAEAASCISLFMYPAVVAVPVLLNKLWSKKGKEQGAQQLADEILQTCKTNGFSKTKVVETLTAGFPYSSVCESVIAKVDPEKAALLKQEKAQATKKPIQTLDQSHQRAATPITQEAKPKVRRPPALTVNGFDETLAAIAPNGPALYVQDRDRAFSWYTQRGFPKHDHNDQTWLIWYDSMAQQADQKGIWDEAWAAFHHALAGYLSKNALDIPRICWRLGRAHIARENYDLAPLYLEAGQRLCDPKQDINLIGMVLIEKAVLTNLAQKPDDYQAALERLNEYFVIPSGPGASVGEKAANSVFRDGYTNHQWLDKAGQPIKSSLILATGYYQVSLDMNRKFGNKQGMAFNLANFGDVWRKLGNQNKALVCWHEALTYLAEIGDQTTTGQVKQWMSEIQPVVVERKEDTSQANAIEAENKQSVSPAVARVLDVLKSPDMTVRLSVMGQAGILLMQNAPGALEPFLLALKDEEELVRTTVVSLLGRFDKDMLSSARKTIETSEKADQFIQVLKEIASGTGWESDDAKNFLNKIEPLITPPEKKVKQVIEKPKKSREPGKQPEKKNDSLPMEIEQMGKVQAIDHATASFLLPEGGVLPYEVKLNNCEFPNKRLLITPDGSLITFVAYNKNITEADVKVFNRKEKKLLREIKVTLPPQTTEVVFRPDIGIMLTASDYRSEGCLLQAFHVDSGKNILDIKLDHPALGSAISPDGKLAASIWMNWKVFAWDLSNGKGILSGGHPDYGHTIGFTPDGSPYCLAEQRLDIEGMGRCQSSLHLYTGG